MKAANDDNHHARSVTRAICNSLKRFPAAYGVTQEDILEGVMKAAGVIALQQLGSTSAVADAFEQFAEAIRNMPMDEVSQH